MKMVRMIETHEGARAGDVVGFESDAEADQLIATAQAVSVRFDAESAHYIDMGKE